MRPKQWIKNLIIFFPAFFGGLILDFNLLKKLVCGFFLFSLISSVGYIINDIIDKEKDARHPKKKYRAIASGKINTKNAALFATFLFLIGFLGSLFLNKYFLFIALIYLANSLIYSVYLKRIPYLDMVIISIGFGLRLYAGHILSNIKLSWWLIGLTLTVAVMLASGKRLEELEVSQSNEPFRDSLKKYKKNIVNFILISTAVLSVSIFGFYLHFKGGFDFLLFLDSSALVFNYVYSVIKFKQGEPTDFFVKNRLNIFLLLLWVLLFFRKVYLF